MSHTPIQAIISLLDRYKIAAAGQRSHIAAKVSSTGVAFTDGTCSMLLKHFASVGGDAASCTAGALMDGTWIQLAKDLARERAQSKDPFSPQESSCGSRVENVTDSNPYGWDNAEHLRQFDHSRPGEWNAFRQCYNLTLAEKMAAHSPTYKRLGCTRWEVLGKEKAPKPFFDKAEVDHAIAHPNQHDKEERK